MTATEAAHDLYTTWGCPSHMPKWLQAIGVGAENGRPILVVYTTTKTGPWPKITEWQGHPVVFKFFGKVVPLGKVTP
jgi:hypothetical protein